MSTTHSIKTATRTLSVLKREPMADFDHLLAFDADEEDTAVESKSEAATGAKK